MAVTIRTPTVNTGSGSLGPMISQHWSQKALRQLYPSLVMAELVMEGGDNAYLRIPKRKGKVVHFWRDPVFSADYTSTNESADDPAAASYVMSAVSATVAQYLKHSVASDLTEEIGIKSAIDRLARAHTFGGLRTFHGLIGGAISAGGTDYYCGDATSASDLTATDILTTRELEIMVMKLRANNIPVYPDGLYKMICHPVAIHELRADTGTNNFWDLVKYISLHEEQKRMFSVGRNIAGFKILESTEIVSTDAISASSGYGFYNIWSGYEGIGAVALEGSYVPGPEKKAVKNPLEKSSFEPSKSNFQIIVKLPGSAGTADPFNRRITVGRKMWTAVKVLQAKACGYLLSGSTFSSTGA